MGAGRWTAGARGVRAVAATVAALGLLATGCGGGSGSGDGKVTIRYSWWGAKDRAELIQKTVKLFEKEYPNIKVKTDFSEYTDFWSKFNTQAAGGNAPDVFQNSYAFLRKYGDKNLLLDLNGQADAGNLSLKGFRDGLEKAGDIDGKLLGVPVGANTFAFFYNPDAYRKAGVTVKDGWTWDDFFAAAKKVRKSDNTLYGASDNANVMYLYDLYLRQNGKAFFTKDDKLGFTKDDLAEWWGRWQQHAKADELVPGKKSEQAKPKASISADLSASEFTWDNFLVRFAAETKTTLDLGPIPTTDGKRTGQYLSSLMLSGSARTQHPKEVAQFIDFMTHDPEVGKIMGYNRGIPATTAQYDAYEPQGVDAKIAAYEKSVSAKLEPITPHPAGADVAEAAFLRIYTQVALGQASMGKAVDQFFSEAESALGS